MIDVLIVEDNADIREMVQMVMEMEGFTAATARHGSAALTWLAAHTPPRLLLVDLSMPVMDGPTFLRQIQANPSLCHIPAIVMTADADPTSRLRDVPVTAIVEKPFEVESLLDAMQPFLGQPAVAA